MGQTSRSTDHLDPPRSAIPPVSNSGRVAFIPAQVVLEEQQAALSAARRRDNHRPTDEGNVRTLSIDGQTRLFELAIRVLTYAVVAAESEVHRIVRAGEVRAAAIVQQAQCDVDPVGTLLAAGVADRARGIPVITAPKPFLVDLPSVAGEPLGQEHPGLEGQEREWDDHASEMEDEFFSTFPISDADAWSFMDDDNLVGAAPALLRRVLRRPSSRRSFKKE